MDRRAAAALQKLANLPPEVYASVAQVLVEAFSTPQPSISASLEAVTKPKRQRVVPPRGADSAPPASRAGQVRELLLKEGPKTTHEIAERLAIPPTHIHPLLASIGAKPVGTVQDADGDERKTYGFQIQPMQPSMQPM